MTVHFINHATVRGQVAAEVRAELARQKIPVRRLPFLLGKSQSYWSRRVNAEQAMDVDDLYALAELLKVPVTRFFEASPRSPFESRGDSEVTRQYHRSGRLSLVPALDAA